MIDKDFEMSTSGFSPINQNPDDGEFALYIDVDGDRSPVLFSKSDTLDFLLQSSGDPGILSFTLDSGKVVSLIYKKYVGPKRT